MASRRSTMYSLRTEGIGFACYIKSFQPMVFHVAEVDALMHALQACWRTLPLATHPRETP